jgi:hypothetical protein
MPLHEEKDNGINMFDDANFAQWQTAVADQPCMTACQQIQKISTCTQELKKDALVGLQRSE